MTSIRIKCSVFLLFFLMSGLGSCNVRIIEPIANKSILPSRLSEYNIFPKGSIDQPADSYHPYRLATPLFTDHAEKQRLFHLPAGTQLSFDPNGNPIFPDSSILVKTFYYYVDKRNPAAGKQLVETRLLVKINGHWNAGTYRWNEAQTDAFLLESGADQKVGWLDEHGTRRFIRYHIPSSSECSACHRSDRAIIPIGPKARNLNIVLTDLPDRENQLVHFEEMGLLTLGPADLETRLPDWESPAYTLEQRARAYLDMNCAHCHSPQGLARDKRLFFDYGIPLADTRIRARKDHILYRLQSTDKNVRMPLLGTTVPDSAGLALVKAYILSLR